jgi:hypothetical protein
MKILENIDIKFNTVCYEEVSCQIIDREMVIC